MDEHAQPSTHAFRQDPFELLQADQRRVDELLARMAQVLERVGQTSGAFKRERAREPRAFTRIEDPDSRSARRADEG